MTTADRSPKRVLVIDGHPDPRPERFCHGLANAYVQGAKAAGHDVRRIDVSGLSFSWLARFEDFRGPVQNPDIRQAQSDIAWAQHLVFIHPLWLGAAPAMLKGFLEWVAAGGFALDTGPTGEGPRRALKGKSARLIVTMGMPALAFRIVFGAFGARAFARGILGLAGVGPVRKTYIGGVELSESHRAHALATVRKLGLRAR